MHLSCLLFSSATESLLSGLTARLSIHLLTEGQCWRLQSKHAGLHAGHPFPSHVRSVRAPENVTADLTFAGTRGRG